MVEIAAEEEVSRFVWRGALDKTLYDDNLCLVASNKQQIQWTRN